MKLRVSWEPRGELFSSRSMCSACSKPQMLEQQRQLADSQRHNFEPPTCRGTRLRVGRWELTVVNTLVEDSAPAAITLVVNWPTALTK